MVGWWRYRYGMQDDSRSRHVLGRLQQCGLKPISRKKEDTRWQNLLEGGVLP